MKIKRSVILAAIILFFALSAPAETVILKSGQKVKGNIIEKTGNYIKIDFYGVPIKYSLEDIDSISADSVETAAKNGTADGPQMSQKTTVTKSQTTGAVTQKFVETSMEKVTRARVAVQKRVPVVAFVAAIILIIAVYIYMSFCLMLIAKKSGAGSAWFAWVPILNIFLMFNIAGVSYWFMLLMLLLLFIPVFGVISYGIFIIYLWYHIANSVNKSGWIGALMIVPIINIIVIGYLAFSKTERMP